jgi:hypothetical protein
MLSTVHAYRDDGPQADTRWKPRRVFCTLEVDHSDEPGTLYVAKLARGRAGAAALISEVVSTHLLSTAGFRTLSPHIVRVSEGFAASCNARNDYPGPIAIGDYYGTLHRDDVEAGPPPSYDVLAQPTELLRLWVFDTWLGNIDREVDGNILLSLGSAGKFRVIAADQSDCFCGAAVFCSDGFRSAMENRGPASSVSFLTELIWRHGGARPIRTSIAEVRATLPRVEEAISLVPQAWWHNSGLTPQEVTRSLSQRAERLESILNPRQWGEVPNAGDALIINL